VLSAAAAALGLPYSNPGPDSDRVACLDQILTRLEARAACFIPPAVFSSPFLSQVIFSLYFLFPSAAESSPVSNSPQASGTKRKPKEQQPPPQGIWYLTPPSPAAAISYIPTVPLVPYSPSIIYCSPAASTSTSSPASLPLHYVSGDRATGLKPWATQKHSCRHRNTLTLNLDDLEDLNWSLSRAVEAAKSMKFTTKRMSRSLNSELSNARGMRGSCLF
uniref:Uncharacterized protein n=1 Tax=Sphenodon punctatus TaxID=8508 RepID=A0A8D0G8V5_SPHPU